MWVHGFICPKVHVHNRKSPGDCGGGGKSARGKGGRQKSDLTCYNCGKVGHIKADCWAEGGDKAGEGPHQKSVKKGGAAKDGSGKKDESANVASADKPPPFAFACSSDFAEIATKLSVLRESLRAIV